MRILGFQKLTTLDYPDTIAALIFTEGCNLLCHFCHNPSLVLASANNQSEGQQNNPHQLAKEQCITPEREAAAKYIDEGEVLEYLEKRRRMLQGICITGGEPLLQPDLADFIYKVRLLDLKIKLDTNGSHPARLKRLIEQNLLDYIALDLKNSLEKYPQTVGIPNFDGNKVAESVAIIRESGIKYEFRTTLVSELHDESSLRRLGEDFGGSGRLYLQNFKRADSIINDFTNAASNLTPFSSDELANAKTILEEYFDVVEIR